MKVKNLLKVVGQALQDYQMVSDGDVLWVGISGSCKSFLALLFLFFRQRYVPIRYQLRPVHVMVPGEREENVKNWYRAFQERWGLPDLEVLPFPQEGMTFYKKAPRQAILQVLIHQVGVSGNKIVLGDCLEDITLSALAALFYHRSWRVLLPHALLNRGVSLLRPLAYFSEKKLLRYADNEKIVFFREQRAHGPGKQKLASFVSQFRSLTPQPLLQVFAAFRHPKKEYFLLDE
ncbi:adenine nucleotide alpha hydrolase family protein [Thermospira aquatica]|uniref:Uncharacterized protein n=1 Tax=Thermospira aquatica TaxID=2828656 RepID=A0AAX3BFM8_9SPIR|nr:hypothetical protein [Thermospira aquatica]URA11105.1 hypothetical protein KDW03_04730 [Thermospira aquatica]